MIKFERQIKNRTQVILSIGTSQEINMNLKDPNTENTDVEK